MQMRKKTARFSTVGDAKKHFRSAVIRVQQMNRILLDALRADRLGVADLILRGNGTELAIINDLDKVNDDLVEQNELISSMIKDLESLLKDNYSSRSPSTRLSSALHLKDYQLLLFIIYHEQLLSSKSNNDQTNNSITQSSNALCQKLGITEMDSAVARDITNFVISLCKPGKKRNAIEQLHYLTQTDVLKKKFPELQLHLSRSGSILEDELAKFSKLFFDKNIEFFRKNLIHNAVIRLNRYKNVTQRRTIQNIINTSVKGAMANTRFSELDKEHRSTRVLKETEEDIHRKMSALAEERTVNIGVAAIEDQETRDMHKKIAITLIISTAAMAINAAIGPLAGNIVTGAVSKLIDNLGSYVRQNAELIQQTLQQVMADASSQENIMNAIQFLVDSAAESADGKNIEENTEDTSKPISIVQMADELFNNVKAEILSPATLQVIAKEELDRILKSHAKGGQVNHNYLITIENNSPPTVETIESLLKLKKLSSINANVFATTADKTRLYIFSVLNGKIHSTEQEILADKSEKTIHTIVTDLYNHYDTVKVLANTPPMLPFENGVLYLVKSGNQITACSSSIGTKKLNPDEAEQLQATVDLSKDDFQPIEIKLNTDRSLVHSIIAACHDTLSHTGIRKFLPLSDDHVDLIKAQTNYNDMPLTKEVLPMILQTELVNWATGAMERVVNTVNLLTEQLHASENLYGSIAGIAAFSKVTVGEKMIDLIKAQKFFIQPFKLELKSEKQQQHFVNALNSINQVFSDFCNGDLKKILLLKDKDKEKIVEKLLLLALTPEFNTHPNVILNLVNNVQGLAEMFSATLGKREFCKSIALTFINHDFPHRSVPCEQITTLVTADIALKDTMGPIIYPLIINDNIDNFIADLQMCIDEHQKDAHNEKLSLEKRRNAARKLAISTDLSRELNDATITDDLEKKIKMVQLAFKTANATFGTKESPHERSIAQKMGLTHKKSIKDVLNTYNHGQQGAVFLNDAEKFLSYPQTPVSPQSTPLYFHGITPGSEATKQLSIGPVQNNRLTVPPVRQSSMESQAPLPPFFATNRSSPSSTDITAKIASPTAHTNTTSGSGTEYYNAEHVSKSVIDKDDSDLVNFDSEDEEKYESASSPIKKRRPKKYI